MGETQLFGQSVRSEWLYGVLLAAGAICGHLVSMVIKIASEREAERGMGPTDIFCYVTGGWLGLVLADWAAKIPLDIYLWFTWGIQLLCGVAAVGVVSYLYRLRNIRTRR